LRKSFDLNQARAQRRKTQALASVIFIAKRQPPSRRSGAMARRFSTEERFIHDNA